MSTSPQVSDPTPRWQMVCRCTSKKILKLEEAFLNNLPPKFSLDIPVFAHFEVSFHKKWLVGVQGSLILTIMNFGRKKK